jgi:hypothetical protein
MENTVSLRCDHRFCNTCWENWTRAEFEKVLQTRTSCPSVGFLRALLRLSRLALPASPVLTRIAARVCAGPELDPHALHELQMHRSASTLFLSSFVALLSSSGRVSLVVNPDQLAIAFVVQPRALGNRV